MKLFFLLTVSLASLIASVDAGPTAKDMTGPPPCPSWYADNEWNLSIWGTYAFTENDYPNFVNSVLGPRPLFTDSGGYDTYLEADHAWGGGIDAKYFFKRYFGFGIEGFAVEATRSTGTVTILPPLPGTVGSRVRIDPRHEERTIGSVLGTFTFRYPLGCSRFAPYVWIGGGAIFGGGEVEEVDVNDPLSGAFLTGFKRGSETRAVGQIGGGFEVRLTKCIGLINDFSWNVVEGRENNFGMARTGIDFAF